MAAVKPLPQEELLQLASEFGQELAIYIAFGVAAYMLAMTIKNLGTEYFTLLKIKLTEFQGTRVGDLVKLEGEIFEVKIVTRERIMFENVSDPDDQIHMPTSKYWNGTIRSKGCQQALKDCKQKARNCK